MLGAIGRTRKGAVWSKWLPRDLEVSTGIGTKCSWVCTIIHGRPVADGCVGDSLNVATTPFGWCMSSCSRSL